MASDSKGTPRASGKTGKPQLTRDDWLDAAAGEVASGGFGSLRVLTLAKKLGVTRGSFYWHFRDHEDLVDSFLDRWRDRRFVELDYMRPKGEHPEEELHQLLQLLLTDASRNVRRLQVELAVRDFARRNRHAAEIVEEVDQARVEQNKLLFRNLGSADSETEDLAMLMYVASVGSQVVLSGRKGNEDAVARIENLVARLALGQGGGSVRVKDEEE
ncbi:TetR/AcrR family transcriptional regulator [Marinobacter sp. AN1]|uniref:TetR/AcrR family transcriptional regulator n=1 Tax=Marinobacter sp. AN1 TaxID=2886046 RepID=UPI002232C06F|nr:TetR/AcrR family transcriptional regulator [Marinobacter sp. AN1]UZD65578.1 TetR/AcrR family transcriptional regulator [Marinobacter sp. AN1]